MVRSLKHLLALLLYSGLTLIMTWPAVSRLKVAVLGDHIDSYLNTWIIAWDIHKITAGEWGSLFDANIFFPYPNTLAYSEHLLGIALLGIPVQLGFGQPVLTFNVLVLSSFVLTALAMYFLVWHLTRRRSGRFYLGAAFCILPLAYRPHPAPATVIRPVAAVDFSVSPPVYKNPVLPGPVRGRLFFYPPVLFLRLLRPVPGRLRGGFPAAGLLGEQVRPDSPAGEICRFFSVFPDRDPARLSALP